MSSILSPAPAANFEADATDGLPVAFPPHLTANFEKADRQIAEAYGVSPGPAALIRLWVACGTSHAVQREFERAVLDIRRKTLNPPPSGEFDDDCL